MIDTAITLLLSVAGGIISGCSFYKKSYIGMVCGVIVSAVAVYRAFSL